MKPVDRLRRVMGAATAGTLLDPADAAWLAQAAAAYLEDPTQSRLDLRLGLHPRWGERSWWTAESRSDRDAVLANMDRSLYADLDLTAAAQTIVSIAARARQKSKSKLPPIETDFLAQIASTGRGIPAFRQVRTILARGRRNQMASLISRHEAPLPRVEGPTT